MKINLSESKKEKISLMQTICILILIMCVSGFFGFIYETIFYKIDLGYFVKRGSTFGPWIPIYAFGGLFITLLTYKYKKNPILIFFLNCIITGILEYSTGYVLLNYFNLRLWDYNTEIWSWGNIDGFICFRSIFFFGLSSLFLIYSIIPILKKFALKLSDQKLCIVSYSLGIAFALDILLYMILK